MDCYSGAGRKSFDVVIINIKWREIYGSGQSSQWEPSGKEKSKKTKRYVAWEQREEIGSRQWICVNIFF